MFPAYYLCWQETGYVRWARTHGPLITRIPAALFIILSGADFTIYIDFVRCGRNWRRFYFHWPAVNCFSNNNCPRASANRLKRAWWSCLLRKSVFFCCDYFQMLFRLWDMFIYPFFYSVTNTELVNKQINTIFVQNVNDNNIELDHRES